MDPSAPAQTRLDELERAVRLNPYLEPYRSEIGRVKLEIAQGWIQEVDNRRRQGAELEPAYTSATAAVDDAASAIKDAIAFSPLEYDNHVLLAELFNRAAVVNAAYAQRALEAATEAVDIEPFGPAARYAAGFAYANLGRLDEAAEQARMAVEMDPNYFAAWVLLGDLRVAKGDPAEARAAYQEALRIQPGEPALQAKVDSLNAGS